MRLADQLSEARRRGFVGRQQELASFESALTADALPFHLLYIYGPGGLGKTRLLLELAAIGERHQAKVILLDARNVDATPDSLIAALQKAMDIEHARDPVESMFVEHRRQIILIDNYEKLADLDGWLRETFLPQLPANVLIVLADRYAPSHAWLKDAGWQSLLRTLPLRNLSPEESCSYLRQRKLPQDQIQAVLDFTHGHPLALSLVADLFDQRPNFVFQPEEAPDLIKTLLEQFVQKVPGPAHRTALEACALIHLTTEPLLAEMLNMPDVHELFEWLRGLSFIESGRMGIYPHDLARETLAADLRWRNRDWYAELHRRAREYYSKRINQAHGAEQQALLFDYIFLHRCNPIIRSCFQWQEDGNARTDALRGADEIQLVNMVRRHEGEESSRILSFWLSVQPRALRIFRTLHQQLAGFLLFLSLGEIDPDAMKQDRIVAKTWQYLQRHAPLRPNEKALFFRFWMDNQSYQGVSPTQSRIFIHIVQQCLITQGIAYTLFPCADPDFWQPVFDYVDLQRIPDLDFQLGDRSFGVFGHDWRAMPTKAWLALLAEREISNTSESIHAPEIEPLIVLSEAEFAAAIHDALRNLANSKNLLCNPLLRSRLIMSRADKNSDPLEGICTLQELLRGTIESLQSTPRDAKLHRVLYRTYINPAQSQEMASEILDLPFSTYRRHLKAGINRVIEALWQQEVNGNGKLA